MGPSCRFLRHILHHQRTKLHLGLLLSLVHVGHGQRQSISVVVVDDDDNVVVV